MAVVNVCQLSGDLRHPLLEVDSLVLCSDQLLVVLVRHGVKLLAKNHDLISSSRHYPSLKTDKKDNWKGAEAWKRSWVGSLREILRFRAWKMNREHYLPDKRTDRDCASLSSCRSHNWDFDNWSNVYLSQGRGRIFRQLLPAEDELLAGDWDTSELRHLVQWEESIRSRDQYYPMKWEC